ncbi:hypothetical protein RchiOBHm_Chr3g0458071 [Rosa chinensis]|uniref:Uncharacterized protein n=1 Tax=Rosa chinensis TaxID=74649 RepID=A0A2P6R7S1_ROSCH|nr:hypothetical protein RchiOBHm_Chr3g0458071 [Rosa chinensis]
MGLLGLGPFAFLWWCLLRFLYHPGSLCVGVLSMATCVIICL